MPPVSCNNKSRLAVLAGKVTVKVPGPCSDEGDESSARGLAAKCIGVSPTYVQRALRIQRERPDLFEAVWQGTISIPKALAELEPPADAAMAKRASSVQSRVVRYIHHYYDHPGLLEELLDRFEPREG